MFVQRRLDDLGYWVHARELVRIRKERGEPKPWTEDRILRGTRFCNVRRMDDKVSKWLVNEWYPFAVYGTIPGPALMAAGLARLINWPDTLGWLKSHWRQTNKTRYDFRLDESIRALRFYRDAGNKIFTGAYIINAAGANGRDKIEVVCRQVNTLGLHGELMDNASMERTHENLMRVPGIGSFIAGQIVADLRHVYPGAWADRDSWAPLGPGSRRGMAWLQGWDGLTKLPRMRQDEFEGLLSELYVFFRKELPDIMKDRGLEAHDLQNCLCEYDKFMRLSNGTGRGKNKYPGEA